MRRLLAVKLLIALLVPWFLSQGAGLRAVVPCPMHSGHTHAELPPAIAGGPSQLETLNVQFEHTRLDAARLLAQQAVGSSAHALDSLCGAPRSGARRRSRAWAPAFFASARDRIAEPRHQD